MALLLCLHASLVLGYTTSGYTSCGCPCGPSLCCSTDQICYTELYGPLSCGYSISSKPAPGTVTKTVVTTVTITSYQCPSCTTEIIDYTTGGSYGIITSYDVTTAVATFVNNLPNTTLTEISTYTSTIGTVTADVTYEETLSYDVSTAIATWVVDFPNTMSTEFSTYTSTISTITKYPQQVDTVTLYITQTTYQTTVLQKTYGSTNYTSYSATQTTPQLEVGTTVTVSNSGNCAASLYMCPMSDGGGCCSSGYACGGGQCTTSAAGAGQYVIAQQAPESSGAHVWHAFSRTAVAHSVLFVIMSLCF